MERKRLSTGIILEADVFQYLELLGGNLQRSRSFLVNAIVRDYARLQQRTDGNAVPSLHLLPAKVIEL